MRRHGQRLAARQDSDGALRLLEKFLRAGDDAPVRPQDGGRGPGPSGEAEGGFTTVDLAQIDLFTGRGAVLKLGAAPSYLRRGGQVERLSGSALPAGLVAQPEGEAGCVPTGTPGRGLSGDGQATASPPDRRTDGLRQALEEFDGLSPQELAGRLLADSRDKAGGSDDQTVIVVKLDVRK